MNRRREALLVVALIFCAIATAQPVQRWMRLYDQDLAPEVIGGVALYDDTTYRFCSSWTDGLGAHIVPTGVASTGDTLWRKSYYRAGIDLVPGACYVVQRRPDGSCLWAGSSDPFGGEPDGALFCFSAAGDSLWLHTYGDTALFESFGGMCVLPDGGTCLVGVAYDTQSRIYVVRTDPAGNPIWTRTIPNALPQVAFSVAYTLDGGFAIGASRSINGSDNATLLLKVDSLGNLLWQRTYGTPYRDNGCAPTELPDGSFLLATAFGVAPVPNTRKQATLIKTDALGYQQWSTSFSDSDYTFFGTAPLIMPNGDCVVSGGRWPGFGHIEGMLARLNNAGALVWERNYTTNVDFHHYIYDLRRTLDGGFIMAGTAFDTVPPLSQDAWLIKTDSFGCLVPGCQVFDAVLEQYTDLTGALTLSPNPTSDLLQVGIALPSGLGGNGELHLTLVDAQGRKVMEQQVIPSPSLSLSLGSFAAGIYFLHLTSDRKWLAGGKVIKE